MRAVVDNPTLAALNGAPPVAIARYSWMLGSVLAALSGILLASNGSLARSDRAHVVRAGAYGAAVVGKLKSLPLTFAGAIALGVMTEHARFALPNSSAWQSVQIAIPGIFLFAALLLVPAAKLSVGRIVGSKTPKIPSLPSSVVRSAVFVGAMVVVANVTPANRLFDVTTALVYGLLLLSLVLLTGYSGQISLCQYVFLAMGAWAMGTFFGGHSIFGILLAGLVAVPLGVIVSLPALRLQGLYLALVTFGFASIAGDLLLEERPLLRRRVGQRRSTAHPRHQVRQRQGVSRALRGDVRPVRHRAPRASARAVRPPARRAARQPSGVRDPRSRRAPHEARGLRGLRVHRRAWPARCSVV